jgi:hypothetical protein
VADLAPNSVQPFADLDNVGRGALGAGGARWRIPATASTVPLALSGASWRISATRIPINGAFRSARCSKQLLDDAGM